MRGEAVVSPALSGYFDPQARYSIRSWTELGHDNRNAKFALTCRMGASENRLLQCQTTAASCHLCHLQHRLKWARTTLSPLRNCRSVLNRRTASAVRRHGSDVDPFSDAQGIFQFNTKVTHCAIDLLMAKQKLHRAQAASFAVDFRSLSPAQ